MARRGRGRQNIQYEEPVQEPNKLSHLQPELLTEDVLKDILREKGVTSSTMHQLSKDELAGLFYKHVTPKPQRDLRQNRRGKLLMKVRKKRERIIKDEEFSSTVGGFKGNSRVSATSVGNQNNVTSRVPLITSGLVNSAIPSTVERLKPPPSCINPSRKTIKLGGGSSTPSLNIVDRKTSSSTSSPSGNIPQKKVIKLSGTPLTPSLDRLVINKQVSSGSSGEFVKRTISDNTATIPKKLKTEVENGLQKRKASEESEEPKKPPKLNRKPISFP